MEYIDNLSLRSISLSNQIMHLKCELESLTSNGYNHMAKARYIMGTNTISHIQLPVEGSENEVRPKVRTTQSAADSRIGSLDITFTQFHIHNQEKTQVTKQESDEEPDTQVRRRNVDGNTDEDHNDNSSPAQHSEGTDDTVLSEGSAAVDEVAPTEPLRWFGILVPQSLKESQKCFSRAIHVVTALAGLQSELQAVIHQHKMVQMTPLVGQVTPVVGQVTPVVEEQVAAVVCS